MIGTSDRLCWLAETCKILLLLLLTFVILHAENACQVSESRKNPLLATIAGSFCCVLRTLGAGLLGTPLMQAVCAQGPVWQTTQCPVIDPVAATQTNPRLRLIGMLHGLCGDAFASALVYQRLQTSTSMPSAGVISNRTLARTVRTCKKCVMHRSIYCRGYSSSLHR